MGESELEVLKTILSNTDSVIVVLFVLVILFLVIAFIPIYKLILQSTLNPSLKEMESKISELCNKIDELDKK